MNIPVNFTPRWYQAKAIQELEAGARLAVWCWARRGGKDFTAFAYAVKKMVEQPMNVALVFPTKTQGKEAFWDNVENDGFKTIDHIPKSLRASTRDDEMKITLKNGSTFQVLGATKPDKLRGANAKLYIFSEFVDIDSAAYEVIVPVVEVNGGQVIIQSTPKIDGISGGTFKMMFDEAMKDPMESASLVTAKEYLSDETLERLRRKAIKKWGNDYFYRQEFLCDWGQASATSYYGQILKRMEDNGQIGTHPYNSDFPVYTAWDLGMADSTAIAFFQYYMVNDKPRVRIIDYYEGHDLDNKVHVNFLKTKPYVYKWHFFPHDGSVRDSDAIQRIEKIRGMGLANSSLLIRGGKDDGINRAVTGIASADIHEPTTTELIRKLYLYKKKYNPHTGDYEGPEHKTESHAADTVRYLYDAIEQEFKEKTCEMYYSQAPPEPVEDLVVTNLYSPAGY